MGVHDSCAVDQDVQLTPFLHHLAEYMFDVGFGCDIAFQIYAGAGFGLGLRNYVDRGHFGTLFKEATDDCRSDTISTSRDHSHLTESIDDKRMWEF